MNLRMHVLRHHTRQHMRQYTRYVLTMRIASLCSAWVQKNIHTNTYENVSSAYKDFSPE